MADEIKIKAPTVEQEIHLHVDGKDEIKRLGGVIEDQNRVIDELRSKLQDVNEEINKLNHSDVGILKSEISDLKGKLSELSTQAFYEFRNVLGSMNIDPSDLRYDELFNEIETQVKNGEITASQAVMRFKSTFRSLIEENYNSSGGLLDTQMIQTAASSLERLADTVQLVVERLNSIEQNGVKAAEGFGAGGDISNVLEQIENAARGMSEEVKGSYESITSLVTAMNEYANLDSTRILGVSQAFRNIADIGKGSYGTKSIENIVYLTKQLQALSASGSSIRFDFTGFNDLKVSKASVSNLATYLPQIASVNVSKLEKLSQVNLTNFNNVKVSKSAIENISRLTEAIQVLKEVKAASVKADESSISITGAEREKQDTSHYKDATRAVKEYYAMLAQLGKAKSDVTLTSEGWKSESGQWNELAAALNRTKTAFDLYTNAENQSKMTDEERINFLRLLTSESEKYAISSEKQANKEAEAAERAARKAEEKAEREKAAAEKAADAREDAAQRAADKEAASEAKRQEASKMSPEQIETNLLKIEKLSLSLNSTINNANALGIDSEKLDSLRALADELETLRENTANGSVTNNEYASSMERIRLAASMAGASTENLTPGTKAFGNAQQELARKMTQAQNALRSFTAAEKSSNETSRTAYKEIQNAVESYKQLSEQLIAGKISPEEFASKIRNLSASVVDNTRIIKENGDAHQTIGEKVQGAIAKFGQWFSVTRIVMAAYRAMKQMVSSVIEVDTAMTELRKVTEESESTYAKFLENATVRARSLGAALADTVNATADFARLGYTLEEAEQLSDAAIIYKNVGDGIEDISEASESIISTMKAFGIETQDALFVVDKFNEVGNNFAISSKGVGDALVRSASAMHAANNTLDETIALITTANTVVQNPDSVGTAMKTLSMYLRAAKTEAEEAGESTDGMADSVSELREELLSLTGGKVDIQIDDDTFKSTYQIIKELSEVWQDLSDVSQANILEMVGGKRNSNVVSALIENFELAERVMETSAEAAGSATAENEKFLNSIQGHINQFKASFETFSQSFIDGGLVKFIVDVGTTILGLLNGVTKAIDALGGLKTVLLAVSSVLLITNGELIGVKVQMLAVAAVKKLLTFFTNVKAGLLNVVNITRTAITAWKDYAAGTVSASAAMQSSIPVIGLVLAAITALVGALSLYGSKSDEAAQKSKDSLQELDEEFEDLTSKTKTAGDSFRSLRSSMEEIAPRYAELSRGVNELGNNMSLTEEDYQEWIKLNNEIADMFPELNVGMDANGNAMLALSGNVDTLTESLLALVKVERQETNAELIKNLPDLIKNVNEQLEIYNQQESTARQKQGYASREDDFGYASFIEKFENARQVIQDVYGAYEDYLTFDRGLQDNIGKLVEQDDEWSQLLRDLYRFAPGGDEAWQALLSDTEAEYDWYNYYAMFFDSRTDAMLTALGNAYNYAEAEIQQIEAQKKPKFTSLLSSFLAWAETDADYAMLDDDMQKYASKFIGNIDIAALFEKNGEIDDAYVEDYIREKIIYPLKDASPEVRNAVNELFSISPEDISVSDYIDIINEKVRYIADNSDFDFDTLMQLSGYQQIIETYENSASQIMSLLDGVTEAQVKSLSPEELTKALDYIKRYGIQTWDDLQSALANKTFDIVVDFSTESENYTKLNAALNEAASATGLTAESVEVLKQRYSELEGYNPASLFEHTANGIHLNANALNELESEYQSTNKAMLDNKLDGLIEQYNNLTESINEEQDAAKQIELYAQRDAILTEISDTKDLISQYNGLTSAYNKWLQAKSQTDEREGYKNIGEGYSSVGKLLEQGWVNDSEVNEYLDLLLAADERTKDNIADFNRLSQTIEGTNFSIMDFFQYDENNNLVSDGLYNFLNAVRDKLGSAFVQIGEDGKYAFDFTGDKLQKVADAMHMSVESVQLLEHAMVDAGFDVIFDSTFSDVNAIIASSEEAMRTLKELKVAGKIESDIDFSLNTTDISDAETQIENAKNLLSEFTNEDGSVNLELKGAREAATILATLIYRKSDLEAPAVMGVVVDDELAETGIGEIILKMQELKDAYAHLEFQTELGVDTTDAQSKVDALLSELSGLLGNEENAAISATLEIDTSSAENAIAGINGLTTEMLVSVGLDTSAVDSYDIEDVQRSVIFTPEHSSVDGYITYIKNLKLDKVVTITYNELGKPGGTGEVDGTAHANGTAMLNGYWGTKNSGTALGGELGRELVVRDGHFFTIGDSSAEMFQYKKGDIIFNAEQTRQILLNGRITSGSRRGRAYYSGTAFDIGSGGRPRSSYDVFSYGGSVGGAYGSTSSSRNSNDNSDGDNWFERQYKLHNHLVKMEQETDAAYFEWLNKAYQQAYNEGIIDIDEYRKYQEEVFEGFRDLFRDYLNDIEHEISMRENFELENGKIISMYKDLMSAVDDEIAKARAYGLSDEDDYIQELQKKWIDYYNKIKDIREDAYKGAKDAVDELVEYRIDMLKKDVDKEKDALDDKLDYLKEFYDKQKKMLQDAYDEEKYLDEQSEKRKSVSDIQSQLAQLEFDNSAWAQKRKLELSKELADAQKELDDFEKQHALDETLDLLDNAYDEQEKQIKAEMDALEERLNDPEALYNQALSDIREDTGNLYEAMLEYNRRYGSGNDEDVSDMWEDAYKELLNYNDIYDEPYKGIMIHNSTNYEPDTGSWNNSKSTASLQSLADKGIINSPAYWEQHSGEIKYLTDLFQKLNANTGSEVTGSYTNVNSAIDALASAGVIDSPDYWKNACKKLEWLDKFIISATNHLKVPGYATGTRNATAGMHSIDEFGTETIFESADGTRYKMFSGGEKVLNAKASDFLYEFANGGGEILEKIIKTALGGGIFDKIMPIVNKNEINMGDIIIQGSATEKTVSEIRRAERDNLKNMLQSLNKLNK